MFSNIKKVPVVGWKIVGLALPLIAVLTAGCNDKTGPAAPIGPPGGPVGTFSSPAKVDIKTAANYVLLAKTGITDANLCAVTGDAGNPSGSLILLSCPEMKGGAKVHEGDTGFADSSCAIVNDSTVGTSIGDMQAAYTDAVGRAPDVTELGGGEIGGLTLGPGVYKWTTDLLISTDVTLTGSSSDVFIFDTTKGISIANAHSVILKGGVNPKNIFWTSAENTVLGTTSKFSGIILSQTEVVINHQAVLTGRAFAQSQITLDANAITHP